MVIGIEIGIEEVDLIVILTTLTWFAEHKEQKMKMKMHGLLDDSEKSPLQGSCTVQFPRNGILSRLCYLFCE